MRSASGLSSRSETWRTCRRSGCWAAIATRGSTRTRTPIHGRGSCTTSMSSEAKTRRSRFSRHTRVARGGAFIVDSFDPRHEAVVEHDGKTTDETLRELQGGRDACTGRDRDRATIQRYSGNSVSLRVEAACPGLLVLPDTYFPGWKATVNGRDRTIYPTDGAFRGVTVPEGTSQRRIPLRAASLPDRSRSRSGRARGVPRHRVGPLVAYAEPTSANAEPQRRAQQQSRRSLRATAHSARWSLSGAHEHLADVDGDLAMPRPPPAAVAWHDPASCASVGLVCRSWPNK